MTNSNKEEFHHNENKNHTISSLNNPSSSSTINRNFEETAISDGTYATSFATVPSRKVSVPTTNKSNVNAVDYQSHEASKSEVCNENICVNEIKV